MKLRVALFFLSITFLIACGTSEQKTTESTNNSTAPVVSPVDDLQQRKLALTQFNALEKLFENQNYLITQGKDSSYIYFSRLNNYLFQVHSYKMIKGDSTQLTIDQILLNTKNEVTFNWKGMPLQLKQATEFAADWVLANTDSTVYRFKKIDQNKIQLINQAGNKLELKKTLALSTFLVRSYYDFQHGTKLAFDSVNFTKR